MLGRISIRNIGALLALTLLIGLYSYTVTAFVDSRLRFALISLLVFVVVLAKPAYDFLRYKQRPPWPAIFIRTFLAAVFAFTGIPLLTLAGLMFGGAGIAWGLSLIFEGQVTQGFLVTAVWAFAIYGLLTLWSLAKHYWGNPFVNPVGLRLKRHIGGLVLGLLSVPGLWMSAVAKKGSAVDGGIAIASLLTIPAALFFVMLLTWNHLRRSRRGALVSKLE